MYLQKENIWTSSFWKLQSGGNNNKYLVLFPEILNSCPYAYHILLNSWNIPKLMKKMVRWLIKLGLKRLTIRTFACFEMWDGNSCYTSSGFLFCDAITRPWRLNLPNYEQTLTYWHSFPPRKLPNFKNVHNGTWRL